MSVQVKLGNIKLITIKKRVYTSPYHRKKRVLKKTKFYKIRQQLKKKAVHCALAFVVIKNALLEWVFMNEI